MFSGIISAHKSQASSKERSECFIVFVMFCCVSGGDHDEQHLHPQHVLQQQANQVQDHRVRAEGDATGEQRCC